MSLETGLHIYGYLIYNKGSPTESKEIFLINGARIAGYLHGKK